MRLEEGIEFVQAAILLRDTILQPRYRTEERVWRSEDQSWRREDRQWRGEDMEWRQEEQRFMNNQKQWRLHDLEQRSLDNARVIWGRFMEKNRRDVEERAEQLKSLGNLAALVAGFAVVAFLEFGDDVGFKRNHALTLAFGTTAALVVGLNMNVMVSTSLLHASILRSGKLYVNEAAEAEFMQQCLAFVTRFQAGMDPPAPRRTFEKHWDSRCERDWRWAFMLFVSGLVCFALNLVLATWIKFRHVPTCIVVTTLLALSLVFVGRLLAFWAPDLFSRRPWTDDALRAHVLQLGSDTGMPFAWHRVPRQADVPRDGADSNFQDADSAFTYVDNSSNTGSDTSTAFPPVATAFSTMSQPVQNQDFQEAYMDMQSLTSAAITQENRGNSVPHSAYPMNDHVGSREHHEAHYIASDRLRRSSSAHGGTDGDSNRMQTHTMDADGGTEWDAGLRTGSWRSPSQSQSRSPRPRVQNGSADAFHAAPVDSRAQSRHRGNADMHTAHGATHRSPNQPRAVAEGVTSESDGCEGCAHQSMRMHQRAMRHTRAQCCSRHEVCGVSNREREYSGNVFQPLYPTADGRGMGQGGGRCAWEGKHVKCVGRRTSSSGA